MSSTTDPSTPSSSPRLRVPPLWLAVLLFVLVLLFAPLVSAMIQYGNDYLAHIRFASELETEGKLLPHFLYHILLIGISHLLPLPSVSARYVLGASILGILCYLWLGWQVFSWMTSLSTQVKPRWRWVLPLVLVLGLMVTGPINFFTWGDANLYWGYLLPNTYHNPTIVLLKPFAIILFGWALHVFESQQTSQKTLAICVVAGVLGTLAKPSYALAFLPALGLVAGYAYLKKRPINWPVLGAIIVPIVLVLLWQFIFYRSGAPGGFEFAPLKVMSSYSDNLLPKFLLSIAFPAAVYLLYLPEARTRIDLNLCWLAFAFAAGYTYLLAETQNFSDGNFTWGTQATLFILFIVSTLFLFRQFFGSRAGRWKFWLCMGVLMLHVAGGLALYLTALTLGWQNWF